MIGSPAQKAIGRLQRYQSKFHRSIRDSDRINQNLYLLYLPPLQLLNPGFFQSHCSGCERVIDWERWRQQHEIRKPFSSIMMIIIIITIIKASMMMMMVIDWRQRREIRNPFEVNPINPQHQRQQGSDSMMSRAEA